MPDHKYAFCVSRGESFLQATRVIFFSQASRTPKTDIDYCRTPCVLPLKINLCTKRVAIQLRLSLIIIPRIGKCSAINKLFLAGIFPCLATWKRFIIWDISSHSTTSPIAPMLDGHTCLVNVCKKIQASQCTNCYV